MEVKVEKATEVAAKQGMLAFIDKFCFLPVNLAVDHLQMSLVLS